MTRCENCFTRPALCFEFARMQICMACYDEFQELSCMDTEKANISWHDGSKDRSAAVASLYWYSGTVRDQIIGAKVKCDIAALSRILQIWTADLSGSQWVQNIDGVMPCPSSLWSRLHGKIDVAWFLASQISKIQKVRLVLPSRNIYWRLKKRSRLERSVDNLLISPWITSSEKQQSLEKHSIKTFRYLVVDDVITTGETLKTCMESVSRESPHEFSGLTFARAR